ncbi:MAG: hypothetical protein B7Z66_12135 [Chromatiales bacterium 21-64-14]|nr:MAG: hypothetical protein B7Z66_12135 [Chromatiales bacterium 21-64-14]
MSQFVFLHGRTQRSVPGLRFDPVALPRPAAAIQLSAEQLQRLKAYLRQRDRKLSALLAVAA